MLNEIVKTNKKNYTARTFLQTLPIKYEYRKPLEYEDDEDFDDEWNPKSSKKYVFTFKPKRIVSKWRYYVAEGYTRLKEKWIFIYVNVPKKMRHHFEVKVPVVICGCIKERTCRNADIVDVRKGIVPAYTLSLPYSKSIDLKRQQYIEQLPDPFIKENLRNIHYPTRVAHIQEALDNLLSLEMACVAHCFGASKPKSPCNAYVDLNDLPMQLTPSQKAAVHAIYADLEESKVHRRLLTGDVGSGKTYVAFCAIKKVVASGYKALFIAPTSLLAQQVYKVFSQLGNFSTALITAKSKKNIMADVYVGTHALIYRQPVGQFALSVIDEQHRFGVKQRATFLNRYDCDVLMMSATPIPRSMQMMLRGYISFSHIDPRPEKAGSETYVVNIFRKFEIIDKVIDWADNGMKVIWVCNSIPDATLFQQEMILNVQQRKKNCSIYLIHSKAKDKNEILEEFDRGPGAILISTTVVEVGLDLDIYAMVIENADALGLAQIHQLRGRVGRRTTKGVCILLGHNISKLKAIQQSSEGLEISNLDMQIRGEGRIHTKSQSGFSQFIFAKELQSGALVDKAPSEEDVEASHNQKVNKFAIQFFFEDLDLV